MVSPNIKFIALVLQVIFLALKLGKAVTWSWLIVLTPTITFAIIMLLSYALLGYWLIYALATVIQEVGDDAN